MKKIIILFLALYLLCGAVFAETLSETEVNGETAILIDYKTGKILWSKYPHQTMSPASTTKMMTAIIILENHSLDEKFIVDDAAPGTGGSHIAIDYGEEFTVEQLLYALLVESANDAAAALAIYHAGSLEAFADEMNLKAIELGCKDTNFVNPHGLDATDHYSSAYDLAMIGRYAFQNETFSMMVGTSKYTIPPTNKKSEARDYLKNSNKFLNGIGSRNKIEYDGQQVDIKYDIVDGIKTGYTGNAGNCLVSTAKTGNERYIAVVMKSNSNNNVYRDSRILLDYGFQNFQRLPMVTEGSFIKTVSVDSITINLVAGSEKTLILDNSVNISEIKQEIRLQNNISMPLLAGTKVGELIYVYNNQELAIIPLLSEYDISNSNLVTTIETALIKRDAEDNIDYGFYFAFLVKLLITFILYRSIITSYYYYKRKKKLEEINETQPE